MPTTTMIWQAVLGELEVTTSKAHFETWLRHTKLAGLTETTAIISVPTIFVRSWVETHYKGQLIASFQKHVATITNIQFQIETVSDRATMPFVEDASPVTPTFQTPPIQPQASPPAPAETTTIARHQTFATFVEGNNNRLACTVSQTVANSPGSLYNPLFIYGGVGLGKTHLMHAIANTVLAADPRKRVLYVSCEKFTNDYIAAIGAKKMDKFKQVYRTLDLLLVDDIQFIANKEGSQEEFFNTFNTLHQSNRQIVIAADRAPNAIPGLEERLSSRLGWGVTVDIQPPNLETRVAILASKCQEKGMLFPDDALEYMATQIQSNIRDLEGALNRAMIYCQMSHVPPSLESAKGAISGLITPVAQRTYPVDKVLTLIAEYFGVNLVDLLGKKRQKELVYPRHVAMYIMREEMQMTFPEIGREMGGKDHTTAMHGHAKIATDIAKQPKVGNDVTQIKQRLVTL